jgi:hypothetical protein
VKKSKTKTVCVVVIIVSVGLIAAALCLNRPTPVPPFKFIGGREPVARIEDSPHRQESITYSFEADFNDVYASAGSELSALGYTETTRRPSDVPRTSSFQLITRRRAVAIWIIDRHKYTVYSTPQHSEYSSPDRLEPHGVDGWVSVRITQNRRPNPVVCLLLYPISKVVSWFR